MIGRTGSFLRDPKVLRRFLKLLGWLVDFVFVDQDRLELVGEDPGDCSTSTFRGRLAKIVSPHWANVARVECIIK